MPDPASLTPRVVKRPEPPATPARLIEATDPAPAHPRARHDRGRYTRRYLDSVGRPMTGRVTITRQGAHADDSVVTVGPAPVELANGYLDVQLVPGDYELAAQLRTSDGVGVVHKDVVTIPDA